RGLPPPRPHGHRPRRRQGHPRGAGVPGPHRRGEHVLGRAVRARADREGRRMTTVRYAIAADLTPAKRAVLPSAVTTHPEDLPAWMDTTALDAVMSHPAADIAAAITACGTNDPAVLLGHLTKENAS